MVALVQTPSWQTIQLIVVVINVTFVHGQLVVRMIPQHAVVVVMIAFVFFFGPHMNVGRPSSCR